MSDWLLARERERSLGDARGDRGRPDGGAGQSREHRDSERPPSVVPDSSQAERAAELRDLARSPQVLNPAAGGAHQRDTGPTR